MKKTKLVLLLLLCVCLLLPMISACGNAEEIQPSQNWIELEFAGNKRTVSMDEEEIEAVLFDKYYVFSREDEETELLWDFEHRLMHIGFTLPPDSQTSYDGGICDAICERITEECTVRSEELGIPFADYVREHYFRLPYCYWSEEVTHPNNSFYFMDVARAEESLWLRVSYIAELWGLEADSAEVEKFTSEGLAPELAEFEALKLAVFRKSVENAKIVYRHKSPALYLLGEAIMDAVSTDIQLLHEIYVIGEDGYAAVYSGRFGTRGDDLDPYVGDPVCGISGYWGVYRFADRDSWDSLVERNGGTYMLVEFDRWVEAEGDDYNAFVAIYGVEPKIHP